METKIIEGGIELIDTIAELWSELNSHHAAVSPYFAEDFKQFKFADRKAALTEKAKLGRLMIALFNESGKPHGYCIASIEGNEGEIDSIYIEKDYRNRGIGNKLMTNCMNWLKHQKVTRIKVGVVFGNEVAHSFYGKFGLLPRVTFLTSNKWHSIEKDEKRFVCNC